MNPGSQRPIRVVMGGLALCGVLVLAVALIGLNLPPEIVLAVALAGIAMPIFVLRPEAGLHLDVTLTFFEAVGGANRSLTVGKLTGALILAGWLLGVAVSRKVNLKPNALVMAMLGFVGWSALSILEAFDNDVAIRQTLTYLQLFLVMLMTASVINTPEKIHRILRTLVLATTLVAAHGLLKYGLGQAETSAGVVENRNLMASYLAFAIPCAYLVYQAARSSLERLILTASLPVLFLAMALTFSRTGLIALVCVLAMVVYRLARREQGFRLLGVSAVMVVLIAVGLPGAFYKRVESIAPTVRRQEDTFGMRLQLAQAGIRMINDHPILGTGAGNYPLVLARYGRGGYLMGGQWASHNTYVGLASESGIPVLILFLTVLGCAFKYLIQTIRLTFGRSPQIAYYAIAVETSLVALVVSGLSNNMEKVKFMYVFFGLALSLEAIRVRLAREAAVPAPAPAEPAGQLDPDPVAAR